MKTTLDLPDDVAHILRMESARRGGRRKASLSKLVTDAVRIVYTPGGEAEEPQIDFQPGRVVVRKAPGAPIVGRDDILRLLWDDE
ncbi:MAG: hypothetical protein WD708_08170 [Kiritimatiellia bacterium]